MPVKTSTADIERQIAEKIRRDAEVLDKTKEFAEEVAEYWRSIAPVSLAPPHTTGIDGQINKPGDYRGAIHVEKDWRYVDGLPAVVVKDSDPLAGIVEYGTSDRHQGGSSPEAAPRAKTEAHFIEAGK